FTRPVYDVTLLLARVRVLPTGAPARPVARLFWQRAFESADLPDDPARRLRNLQEDGVIDAGWLAQNVMTDDPRARAARFDQLTFGQRVFAAPPDAAAPDDVDAQLIQALAGVPAPAAGAQKVVWEDRTYSVDLVSPEQRRLSKARDKMGAPTIRLALDLEHVAARLSAPSATVP